MSTKPGQLQAFTRDERKTARISDEIEAYFQLQKQINQATGKARRIYIRGNHGKRLEVAINRRLPGLIHLDQLGLNKVLQLDKLSMEYDDEGVMLGNAVQFVHGWRVNKWSGVTPRMHLEQIEFMHSVVHAHSHRQSVISKWVYGNRQVFGVEVGHHSDFRKMTYLNGPPDWCAGCCLLTWRDGKLGVELIPYHGTNKLTALWRGRLYRA